MRKNINPQIWGESGWTFLSSCLSACDEESRSACLMLIHILPQVLPCTSCREHTRAYIATHPPKLEKDLVKWLDAFKLDVKQRLRLRTKEKTRTGASYVLVILTSAIFFSLLLYMCSKR